MQEFSISYTYQISLRYWWLLLICIIAGGLLGLLFHSFQPPLYEAETILIGSLNFPPSGFYSQYEEDYAFAVAATHISPLSMASTLLPMLSDASSSVPISIEEFLHSASLERKQSAWYLRYRSAESDLAVKAVELWANQAYEKLSTLRDHAIRAQSYLEQLRFFQTCSRYALLSPLDGIVYPPDYQGICLFSAKSQIHAQEVAYFRLFSEEIRQSGGVNPYFVINIPDSAVTQVYLTAYDRNLLILVGMLIGLILGLWLVNLRASRGGHG